MFTLRIVSFTDPQKPANCRDTDYATKADLFAAIRRLFAQANAPYNKATIARPGHGQLYIINNPSKRS